MNAEQLIKRHEGYENRIYKDTVGIPTLGYGHALHVGSRVPMVVADAFFEQDMIDVRKDYASLGLELDEVREAVVLNMIYNLGIARFRGFKRTLYFIEEGNYRAAAYEMLDSKWAGQVGGRALELSKMMDTGRWPE